LIDGPFEGLEIPYSSAKANAAYITRTLVDTYLITHPHLDHICGFVLNTASLPGSRPKRLAGLPSTIEAFKNHIFNNVIWPNLSDENNGAGLVTYMRLVEGGSPALGDGEGKGYVEISEGLSVKTLSVSHGHCIENHSHRGSNVGLGSSSSQLDISPRLSSTAQVQATPRSGSGSNLLPGDLLRSDSHERICVYNSSAYFIRDIATGKEVLIFGDVEPDSMSLSPRNRQVWSEAAHKIASGLLRGIFIECSYDDSQSDDTLFGHLAPRFLAEELKVLANEVHAAKNQGKESKKRKRLSYGNQVDGSHRRSTRSSIGQSSPVSPLTQTDARRIDIEVTQADRNDESIEAADSSTTNPDPTLTFRPADTLPLTGVKIVIIHMKDKLDDGPDVGDTILNQMKGYEEQARLGCDFVISRVGQALYL
jgi:cAMP phosphodiesterase